MLNLERPNRLALETSPYLVQHAHNPVDWYAWGEDAFAKARAEDKPIFLSIGYSTCHWCHVMERESFENEATAESLNRDFISIKVDREGRPDVDRGVGAGHDGLWRMADERVPHSFAGTLFRRHVLPAGLALWAPGVPAVARIPGREMEIRAFKNYGSGQFDDRAVEAGSGWGECGRGSWGSGIARPDVWVFPPDLR